MSDPEPGQFWKPQKCLKVLHMLILILIRVGLKSPSEDHTFYCE